MSLLFVFFTIKTWERLCKIFLEELNTLAIAVETLRLLYLFFTWKLLLMFLFYIQSFIFIVHSFYNNDSITRHIKNASDLALSIEYRVIV